jgi:hypothetical protein
MAAPLSHPILAPPAASWREKYYFRFMPFMKFSFTLADQAAEAGVFVNKNSRYRPEPNKGGKV